MLNAKSTRSDNLQNALMDNVSDAIIFTDMSGSIRGWNPAAEALYGWRVDEVFDQQVHDILYTEYAHGSRDVIVQQLTANTKHKSEVKQRRRGGLQLEILQTLTLIYDESGKALGVLECNCDLSEQRFFMKEFQRQQTFLRQIIDLNPNLIFIKDWNGVFVMANKALADSFNTTVEELIGKTDAQFNPNAAEVEKFLADDREVMETMQPKYIAEEQITYANGEIHWNQAIKVPLISTTGEKQVMGIGVDVTERKRAEEESVRLQQEVIYAQQQALRELSTPIIPIMDGIIVMPLIGSIDTLRARDITRSMLAGITQHKASIIILDITGVPIVDSGVAAHLDKTIQAARLKGAKTIITGISDAVAETIVDLGIDWSKLETLRDLQSGLLTAFSRLGIKISRADK